MALDKLAALVESSWKTPALSRKVRSYLDDAQTDSRSVRIARILTKYLEVY